MNCYSVSINRITNKGRNINLPNVIREICDVIPILIPTRRLFIIYDSLKMSINFIKLLF